VTPLEKAKVINVRMEGILKLPHGLLTKQDASAGESPIMGKLTSAPSPRKATLQYACSNKDVVSYMKSTLVFRVGANVRSLMLGST
jgi:hypothetical protein